MKKKLLATLLVAAMVISVTACGGKKNDSTQSTEVASGTEAVTTTKNSGEFELDLDTLVKDIPDYSNLELEIDSQYEVTDAAVNSYLTQAITQFGGDAYKEITDRDVVQAGDYVKVDYTGYKDGEAFDRGADTDVLLDIDNNKQVGSMGGFIEGFTKDIAGSKVGDTIKTDVTFPENYGSEELAGKPAVFEFKIKGIYSQEPATLADLNDEKVNALFGNAGITTVADLEKQLKADLENNLYSAEVSAAKDYMINNSTVEIPEDYFAARYNEYLKSFEDQYASGTQTLEEVVTASGDTYDNFLKTVTDNLTMQIKIEFIFGKIAKQENIELDDEGFEKYMQYLIQNSQGTFADNNAVYEYFGAGNAKYGEKYLNNQYIVNRAVDVVAEKVTPKFKAAPTEESTEAK